MASAILERGLAIRHQPVVRAARTRPPEWTPTIEGADLACLLRVIEGELLPRLVKAYAPASATPLRTDGG